MAISRNISCMIALSVILICLTALPPAYGQSMVPGDQVYACDIANDSVQVLDGSGGTLVTTITGIGAHPQAIIVSPDGSFAYVATTDPGTGASAIVIIDTAGNTIVKKVPVPGAISDITVTQDGKTLYILAYDNIMYLDTATAKIYDSYQLRNPYTRVAIGPDGNHPFLCAQPYGMMYFEAGDDKLGHMHFLGGWHGSDIAPTNDGARVYLCDSPNYTIVVTDTQIGHDGSLIPTTDHGQPQRIVMSPDGSRAFVFTDGHKVLGINTQSNGIASTWDLGDRQPRDMAIAPDGKHLYISCDDSLNHRGTIAVIDTSGSTVSDILTASGISSISVRQVMVPGEASPTSTPTPTPTPVATPVSTPIVGSVTPAPQDSVSPTVMPSPSEFGKSTGICPCIPIAFAALILLGVAGRKLRR